MTAKSDLETATKNEENMGRLEYIGKFPDLDCHEKYHVGEVATISKRRKRIKEGKKCLKKNQSSTAAVYICQRCYLCT